MQPDNSQIGEHLFDLKITDNQGNTQIESITVEVLESDKTDNDLTDIIDINSVLNVISENAVNGEEVGTFTVNAYDSVNLDTQIFYSLTDDAGGRFQINSETESLQLKIIIYYLLKMQAHMKLL